MFILRNQTIKGKRSKLVLNCESSKVKRACSTVKKFILKQSEHVYIKELNYYSKAKQVNIKL
jgi:hypothetical protein